MPLPIAVLAAYLNVVVLEQYESKQKESLETASAYAAEHVENIQVSGVSQGLRKQRGMPNRIYVPQTVAALGREEAVLRHFESEMEKRAPPRRQLYLASFGFGVGTGFVLLVSAVVMVCLHHRVFYSLFRTNRYLRLQIWGSSIYSKKEVSLAALTSSLEAIILAGFACTRVFS